VLVESTGLLRSWEHYRESSRSWIWAAANVRGWLRESKKALPHTAEAYPPVHGPRKSPAFCYLLPSHTTMFIPKPLASVLSCMLRSGGRAGQPLDWGRLCVRFRPLCIRPRRLPLGDTTLAAAPKAPMLVWIESYGRLMPNSNCKAARAGSQCLQYTCPNAAAFRAFLRSAALMSRPEPAPRSCAFRYL